MAKLVVRRAQQYTLNEKTIKLLDKVQKKTGKNKYKLVEEAIRLLATKHEVKQTSHPTRSEIVQEQNRVGSLMKALCKGYENTHKGKMPHIHKAIAKAVIDGNESPRAVWEAARLDVESVFPSVDIFMIYVEANGIPDLRLAKKICKRAEEEELEKRF